MEDVDNKKKSKKGKVVGFVVLALLFVRISFGWANPVTQSPYFGVGSAIVCPPATTAPASAILL